MSEFSDEFVCFADEDDLRPEVAIADAWKLLVVDDEPEVHKVTELALSDFAFEDRRVQIYSAYSGGEARQVIAEHPDTAVILLDVVMETDGAGLEFARFVRDELANKLVRIVLRTGQPGAAPEHRVIVDYDINDYKNKAELTSQRLFTTLVASLRSHRDLCHISDFNRALVRFVPSELTTMLGKRNIIEVSLGDHVERDMAVLFSDLRSFTTISERLSPQEAFQFLNAYLAETGPIIRAHHGYIDKYVGDAILAIFPGGADDALHAALAMQTKVDELNERRSGTGEEPIRVGVGVHAGPVVLGVIGEELRLEGTVIADSVNLASRLQGLCKEFGIRIVTTADCLASAGGQDGYAARYLGSLALRGKTERIDAYELFDCDPAEIRDGKLATREGLERGLRCLAAGQLEESARALRAVVEVIPDDPVALDYLARATVARRARLLGHETLAPTPG